MPLIPKKVLLTCLYLGLCLCLVLIVALKVGAVSLSWRDVFFLDSPIISYLRLPRILLAIMVGAGLSMSGVIFQAILKNPLADPYVLGVSSGGAIGAVLSVILGVSTLQPLFAFSGSLLSIIFVLTAAKKTSGNSLILAGVILNFFLASILALLLALSSPDQLSSSYSWLLGSLAYSQFSSLVKIIPPFLGAIIFLYFCATKLNVLSLGEEKAISLGVSAYQWRLILLILTSLVTSLLVSVSGIIGFVGLIVPHAARSLWGYDHRLLIPASALLGAIFMVVSDTLARTVFLPAEIPVGVFTALIGAPIFIYFLRKGYDFQNTRS